MSVKEKAIELKAQFGERSKYIIRDHIRLSPNKEWVNYWEEVKSELEKL